MSEMRCDAITQTHADAVLFSHLVRALLCRFLSCLLLDSPRSSVPVFVILWVCVCARLYT
jgi:hypothetical protein